MAASAAAIPARPGTFTVRQSDGTVLTLRMVGDEHFHYFVNVDNGKTMLRADNGDFYFAAEAELAPMRAAADVRRAAANDRRIARLERLSSSSFFQADRAVGTTVQNGAHRTKGGEFNGAMKGSKKGLVILMDFPDLKFLPQNNREAYDRVFNQEGYREYGSIGSVRDYFKDQSYGDFDLTFDVVGPYTTNNNMAYYGTDMPFPNDPYNWGKIQDLRACVLPMEAVQKADGDVNFADYDWDGDGEVDQVYIIYPGYAQSSGAPATTIWPHESSLSEWGKYNSNFGPSIPTITPQRLDGVKIDTYAMSQELTLNTGSTRVGIGTACHEFAHCLGFPDFYDPTNAVFGMEGFDIMDNGGYNGPNYTCEVPAGFTAYERWMVGWLEPTVLSEGTEVKDMVAICDKPEAYVIYNEGNHNEYFLLENRQPKSWHKYVRSWTIPGGLLVTHVDFDKTVWYDNKVNADPKHQRMTPVPAGKTLGNTFGGFFYTYESDYRSILFPGSNNVTELNDKSHGTCGMKLFNRNLDGTFLLNAPLHNITADAAKGTVSFVFKDGPDDGNRWTVTYDAGSGQIDPASWTQTKQNESVTLPSATIDIPNWQFVGWSTTAVAETAENPADLLLAGTIYKPTADVTLYAVYGYSEASGSPDDYVRVDGLRQGAQYVFATKGAETDVTIYALNAMNLVPGSVSKTPSGKSVNVDFSGEYPVIHKPAAGLVWTATISGGNVQLQNEDNYLQISSEGFTLSSNPVNLGWDPSYGLYVASGVNQYFVHINSGKFNVNTQKMPTSRVFAYEVMTAGGNATKFATNPAVPQGIVLTTTDTTSAAAYDLQGRRVTPQTHGIYVVGNKKVIR